MIYTHCSQFHNCIPYTDKKEFYIQYSCCDFLFSKSRLLSSDILAEPPFDWFINLFRSPIFSYQEENSIITAIQSVTIQTFSLMKMRSEKNQYLLRYSLPHYPCIILRSFYLPFAITTSGFYFRN